MLEQVFSWSTKIHRHSSSFKTNPEWRRQPHSAEYFALFPHLKHGVTSGLDFVFFIWLSFASSISSAVLESRIIVTLFPILHSLPECFFFPISLLEFSLKSLSFDACNLLITECRSFSFPSSVLYGFANILFIVKLKWVMSSRWSSSLYCPMRNSGPMIIPLY